MAYLEIEGLEKRFGRTAVLHDVSLSLERGRILTLIGPSGEGKTTFLRCLNFLDKPDKGVIRLDGRVIFDASVPNPKAQTDVHRAFGFVFQAFHLFPQYTVLQNVTLAPRIVKHVPDEEAKRQGMVLLEKVGLAAWADRYPNTLSGGQQQRAAIARALAMEPEVLCFDEPTSALDPELTQEVLKVIRLLKDEGRTMIVITHEMAFAQNASDTVVFLKNGTIGEIGAPDELFEHPKTEALRRFLLQPEEGA